MVTGHYYRTCIKFSHIVELTSSLNRLQRLEVVAFDTRNVALFLGDNSIRI